MNSKQKAFYNDITANIIKEIEAGNLKDFGALWHVKSAYNIESKNIYKGLNRLILGFNQRANSYSAPIYGTFLQFNKLGAKIKAGQKGVKIAFYAPLQVKNKETGELETVRVFKPSTVFNIDQSTLELTPDEKRAFNIDLSAENTITSTGAKIVFGGDSAHYTPSIDQIALPVKEAFLDEGAFYSTAFHELTHWTGADTRLNRQIKNRFASPEYAFEELIAELGASFLCADHNIKGTLKHVEYLNNWLNALKRDSSLIVEASKHAQKAVDFIMSKKALA
jgi:antirestriction protein ArdC